MSGKHFAVLACAVLALSVGVAISAGGGAEGVAAPAGAVGHVYGGETAQRGDVWIRLRPDRRAIADMQVEWRIPPARCGGHDLFWSSTDAGAEHLLPIAVRDGRFRSVVLDVYRMDGTVDHEAVTITGAMTGTGIAGQLWGKAVLTRRGAAPVVCKVGPVPYEAQD